MTARVQWFRGAALLGLGVFALTQALAGLDLSRLQAALGRLGPLVPLLLVPFFLASCLDAGASKVLLGLPVRFLDLLSVRLMAEAVVQSLPSGSLVADGLTPSLLRERCGVPWVEGAANVAARKALLLAAQAGFLLVAASAWVVVMHGRPLARSLAVGSLTLALVVLLLCVLLWSWARRGGLGDRLAAWTRSVPCLRLRLWLLRRRASLRDFGLRLDRVLEPTGRPSLGLAAAAYTGMCVVEALETYCVLRLLGSSLDLAEALPLEGMVTWLRAAAFFVPAGLGVQDLGVVALLHAAGVPEATAVGAGWVVLRRAREGFWIAVGYGLLARRRAVSVPP